MLIDYTLGQTGVILRLKVRQDATGTRPGQGFTGLTNTSTGLIVAAICDCEAATTAYTSAGSQIGTIATIGTYAAPGSGQCNHKQVDVTNHPGLIELQLANGRFAVAGAKELTVSITGVTGMADCDVKIPLRRVNPYDGQAGGLAALPTSGILAVNPTLNAAQAYNNSGQTQVLPVNVASYGAGLDPSTQVWTTPLPGIYGPGTAGAVVYGGLSAAAFQQVYPNGFMLGPSDSTFTSNCDITGWSVVVVAAATGAGQVAVVAAYNIETGVAVLEGGAWPAGQPTGTVYYFALSPTPSGGPTGPTLSQITAGVVEAIATAAVGSVTGSVGSVASKTGFALASNGLDLIPGYGNWSQRQTIQVLGALLAGLRSGLPTPGQAGSATLAGGYGAISWDAAGDITASTLTPPA